MAVPVIFIARCNVVVRLARAYDAPSEIASRDETSVARWDEVGHRTALHTAGLESDVRTSASNISLIHHKSEH